MKETITNRIDAVNKIEDDFKKPILLAPPSVKVELTSRCNFHCHYCANQYTKKDCRDMDKELYKRIVKEMFDAGVRELGVFYIGESMLCQWLPEAISYAKKIGFPYVFLTTNGSLANPEKIQEIMEAGLDSLKWSLNSADPWQFRQMTCMAPSVFHEIIKNVKKTYKIREEKGYETKLYASSIQYNGNQLKAMLPLVDEIVPFVDEHYWLPLLSFGSLATKSEKEIGFMPVVGNPGRVDNLRKPLPCWAVFREGHVTSNGELSACCFDATEQWIMADLKKVSFMEGWNTEAFQELRKAHLKGDVHGTACEPCIYPMEHFK